MKKTLFTSILIANRGEIASRIIRTCKKMGIRSIALYSEVDREALFVKQADVAVFVGGNSPSESYLNQGKIIEIAKNHKADAIHPGYGFLSENASFAKKCRKENMVFIGPHQDAIQAMALKSHAKSLMQQNGVPVIPGYSGDDQTLKTLTKEALQIGFPLIVKAVAGGGGKGMRIVYKKQELNAAIEAAKSESLNAFSNDELLIEKYIPSGKHIEFQIFGDHYGNVVHILERECSLQRRYQKVIEESPSPALSNSLRDKMGAAAVKAAKAIAYDNAGTVEFILDTKTQEFFFLEVNTRLQVEHPVTEEITGLDLVQLQIEVAQGMPLSVNQNDIVADGYAIECRLYAEDPAANYQPGTGIVHQFSIPKVEGLRLETAVESGSSISVFYDPMIAKIIVKDKTRESAIQKMIYTLSQMVCLGIKTNQGFLKNLLEHPDFMKGAYDTHFLDIHHQMLVSNKNRQQSNAFASIASTLFDWNKRESQRMLLKHLPSGWRNSFYEPQKEAYTTEQGQKITCQYRFENGIFSFWIEDQSFIVTIVSVTNSNIHLEINGILTSFEIVKNEAVCFVHNESIGTIELHQQSRFPEIEQEKKPGNYEASMPSQIISIKVQKGDLVNENQPLLVVSSMKMESTIVANQQGVVKNIAVSEGQNVEAGFLLLQIEEK